MPGRAAILSKRKRSWLLYLSIGLTLLWVAGLFTLALRTANPVTLNSKQLYESTYIVSAVLTSDLDADIEVQKEWTRNASLPAIRVDNLKDVGFEPGVRHLVPLSPSYGDAYRVTPTPLPDGKPLVYPQTDGAVEQLEALLKSFRDRAAALSNAAPK
jgi:hypothetical protein